jgi:hypothetical protein
LSVPSPHLSKSRYLFGLQCERRLWLTVHTPDDATPPDDRQQHIFEMGNEVGVAAHALMPGGVLVETLDHAIAVEETRSLMDDESVPAIFEAAFEYEGVRIRVDLLERRGAGRSGPIWGLREVKSSTSVKRKQHLPDLAIQKWVLDGCGLPVDSAELVHVNRDFVRGVEGIDWSTFFERVELLDELTDMEARGVKDRVAAMHTTLAAAAAPSREPGSFCKRPFPCDFWDACTRGRAPSWFVEQTGAGAARKAEMIAITESGVPWFSADLAGDLATASPPIWALDFEAIGPAIPFFEGTRPYQAIAFQWSLHRLDANHEITHFEYLASGREDPREAVARALIDELASDTAPILVYSSYEKRCLNDMAEHRPELADALASITDRLVDLLPIVRRNVYHPDLLGSFSIKKVGPAFAPHVRYDDLSGVADGMGALKAFADIVTGKLSQDAEQVLRDELLRYCERDTEALLGVYLALRAASHCS